MILSLFCHNNLKPFFTLKMANSIKLQYQIWHGPMGWLFDLQTVRGPEPKHLPLVSKRHFFHFYPFLTIFISANSHKGFMSFTVNHLEHFLTLKTAYSIEKQYRKPSSDIAERCLWPSNATRAV
jgi:hypothetical protein